MKKFSIIFSFILIAMGILFAPEVQAITKNIDAINDHDVVIYVGQDGNEYSLPKGNYTKKNKVYKNSKGEWASVTVGLDGNGNFNVFKDSTWNDMNGDEGTFVLNITDRTFSSNKPVEFFIATEDSGSGDHDYSLKIESSSITENFTVTRPVGESSKEETRGNTKITLDYVAKGNDAVKSNTYITLEKGTHTVKFHLTGQGINFYVEVNLTVTEEATNMGSLVNIAEENQKSEDYVTADDMRVLIKSGNQKSDNIYEKLTKESQNVDINLTPSEFKAISGNACDIYVYYENENLSDWGCSFKLKSSYNKELIGDPKTTTNYDKDTENHWAMIYGNKAFWGLLTFTFLDTTSGNINIPLVLNIDTGIVKRTININIRIAPPDSDEGREDAPFVDVLNNIGNYTPTDSTAGEDELVNKINIILTVITNIGMIIAVLMSALIGIKYMLGSIEEKAEYKNDMIPYLIGACLLFGVCTVVKILQAVGNNINNIA